MPIITRRINMNDNYIKYSLLDNIKNVKKQYAEFLTPKKLIEFIYNEVGDIQDKVVFDFCGGSGGLIFDLKCKKKILNEINPDACEVAKLNKIDEVYNYDYITMDDSNLNYDIVIANPPFNLKANEEQQEYLQNKYNIKKWIGTLDFEFILKSFKKAKQGYYLESQSLLFRDTEKQYRKYIIDNNYLEKVAVFEKSGFQDTQIPILYLKLNKEKQNEDITFTKYNKYELIETKTVNRQEIIKKDYNLTLNNYLKEEQKKEMDINELNDCMINNEINKIKTQYELYKLMDSLETEVIEPKALIFKNKLIELIKTFD